MAADSEPYLDVGHSLDALNGVTGVARKLVDLSRYGQNVDHAAFLMNVLMEKVRDTFSECVKHVQSIADEKQFHVKRAQEVVQQSQPKAVAPSRDAFIPLSAASNPDGPASVLPVIVPDECF